MSVQWQRKFNASSAPHCHLATKRDHEHDRQREQHGLPSQIVTTVGVAQALDLAALDQLQRVIYLGGFSKTLLAAAVVVDPDAAQRGNGASACRVALLRARSGCARKVINR